MCRMMWKSSRRNNSAAMIAPRLESVDDAENAYPTENADFWRELERDLSRHAGEVTRVIERMTDFEKCYFLFCVQDDAESDEFSVVRQLERERREWHTERVKLVHCIHLQQVELAQKASAANERAAEIAKEFARAIEGFEERLVAVESNVQKEIMAIKSIAESLRSDLAAFRSHAAAATAK